MTTSTSWDVEQVGRLSFFITLLEQIVGIDVVPTFIHETNIIRQRLKCENVTLQSDIRSIDYRKADVLYIYGTCFQRSLFVDLIHIFQRELSRNEDHYR